MSKSRKPDIRATLENGSTEQVRAILGKRGPFRAPVSRSTYVIEAERCWMDGMSQLFPGLVVASWGTRQKEIALSMFDKYGNDIALMGIRYLLTEWPSLSMRVFRHALVPTTEMLNNFHEVIFAEAQIAYQRDHVVAKERNA